MRSPHRGLTLLEVIVALTILAVLGIPLFSLLSMQHRELAWSAHEVFLHGYVHDRLDAERARLSMEGFAVTSAVTRDVTLELSGNPVQVVETLVVEPVASVGGLWKLSLTATCPHATGGVQPRPVDAVMHAVDREHGLRQPLTAESPPASDAVPEGRDEP